jgi:hypothetical protein
MASESIEARLDVLIALVDKHEHQLQRILAQLENVAHPEITSTPIIREETRDLFSSAPVPPSSLAASLVYHVEKRNEDFPVHLQKEHTVNAAHAPH